MRALLSRRHRGPADVSIVRAVSCEAKLVLLDEPTSSLDAKEVGILFDIVRRLQQKGIAFVFITHRLDEVFEISNRITILKDGQYVGTFPTKEMTRHDLVTRMVGREVSGESARRRARDLSPDFLLEVRHLKRFPKVNDVSFGMRKGEVVGLAGMLGSGRTETAQLLCGCAQPDGGEILVNGRETPIASPGKAIARGFAYVPEDRRTESLIPGMSVKNNIVLSSMRQVSGRVFSMKDGRPVVGSHPKRRLKTPGASRAYACLSGGNPAERRAAARWWRRSPSAV